MLFVVLAFFAKQYSYFSIDLSVTHSLQQIHSFWFFSVMIFISQLGLSTWGALTILLFVLIALSRQKMKDAVFIFVSTVGVSLLGVLVKEVVNRPRPNSTLALHLGPQFNDTSFPSGHVLFFVGLYGFLLFLVPIWIQSKIWKRIFKAVIISLLILIGVSRIYLGDHWFSDVVGGYLLGAVWVLSCIELYYRMSGLRFRG